MTRLFDLSNRCILRGHFKSVDCDAIDVRLTLAKCPAHKRPNRHRNDPTRKSEEGLLRRVAKRAALRHRWRRGPLRHRQEGLFATHAKVAQRPLLALYERWRYR